MVEPSGRQMLAVQTSWPTSSRQMAAIVPSWQGIPTQHATIQQPLSELTEWGRPLLVDSSALIQVSQSFSSSFSFLIVLIFKISIHGRIEIAFFLVWS